MYSIPYLKGWTDADGLVTPRPHPGTMVNGSGNGVLYSSLAIIGEQLSGRMEDYKASEYLAVMDSCCKERGLLMRGPHHPDQQAMDDYIGYTTAMAVLRRPTRAYMVALYGMSHYFRPWGPIKLPYYYNNVNPPSSRFPDGRLNIHGWLGRYPGFRGHIATCARMPLTLMERIGLAGSIWFSSTRPRGDQDGWLMGYLMQLVCDESDPLMRAAKKRWRRQFIRVWDGSTRALMRAVLTPGHPVAELWPDV